jgi:hypothetical protein
MYEEDETEGAEAPAGSLAALLSQYTQGQEKLQAEEAARIQSRWQRGTQALQQRRAGPSKTETVAQALLAFGQPTRGGGWAALGNAGNVLAERNAAVKTAAEQRKQQMLALENAREDSLSELSSKYGGARLELTGKLAAQAAKPVTPRTGQNPVTGVIEYLSGPNVGQPVVPSGANVSRQAIKVASAAEALGQAPGTFVEFPDGTIKRVTTKGVEDASPKVDRLAGLTPGQKALDVSFGKDYADWLNQGQVTAQTQLGSLRGISKQLADGGALSGGVIGMLPEEVQARVAEDRVAAQQAVAKAIQETLRATLGAQFTAAEGAALIARSWDPRLSPEANAKKLNATIADLERRVTNKEKQIGFFDANGTLSGFGAPADKPRQGAPPATRYTGGGPKVPTRGAGPATPAKPADPAKLSDAELKKLLGF